MTSQYPQQPFYGYQQQPYNYQPPRPVRRPPGPPGLGTTGLVLAIAALVVSVVWNFVCAAQLRDLIRDTSTYNSYQQDDVFFGIFGLAVLVQVLASAIGTTALIISIVATVQNRGRPAAIAGIVVSGAAPIISYFVFTIAMLSLPLSPEFWDEYSTVISGVVALR